MSTIGFHDHLTHYDADPTPTFAQALSASSVQAHHDAIPCQSHPRGNGPMEEPDLLRAEEKLGRVL